MNHPERQTTAHQPQLPLLSRLLLPRRAAMLATVAALAACSDPPPAPPPAPVTTAARLAPAPAPTPPAQQPVAAAPVAQNTGVSTARPGDGRNLPTSRVATVTAPGADSVYFDFDESVLKPQASPIVDRFAKYLAAKPGAALLVEGHCDERGGREYNLALGQRRAQAVVDALRVLGVSGARIEAVSFGEERPRAAGHDEAAWAQNRRADLQLRAAP